MIFLIMPVFGILISLGTIHLGDTSPIKPNLEEKSVENQWNGWKQRWRIHLSNYTRETWYLCHETFAFGQKKCDQGGKVENLGYTCDKNYP